MKLWKERILETVREGCALVEEVTEASYLSELSLDSLAFVEIIVKLENDLAVEFELDELSLDAWETVGDIIACVEEKMNGKK